MRSSAPSRERRRDDAEGGGERELEARVEEIARPNREDRQGRQREAVRHRGVPLEEDRDQDEHRHDDGAQHRGLRTHDERKPDHDDYRRDGRGATGDVQEVAERPHRGREQRHIEAGDGQDVVDARAPEGLVDVAWQLRAVAEQEPGQIGRA